MLDKLPDKLQKGRRDLPRLTDTVMAQNRFMLHRNDRALTVTSTAPRIEADRVVAACLGPGELNVPLPRHYYFQPKVYTEDIAQFIILIEDRAHLDIY